MALFKRKIEFAFSGTGAGTTTIKDLQVEFDIVRTGTKEPNTMTVNIYNLSEDNRRKIEGLDEGRVQLKAGYDRVTNLFTGDLTSVKHEKNGPDIVTTVEAQDGLRSQGVRFRRAYGKNTTLQTVVKDLVKELELGEGNINEVIGFTERDGLSNLFKNGVVVNGNAIDELTRILSSKGLGLSIQDGNIQVLGYLKGLKRLVLDISETSGLVGTPTQDNKGVVKMKTLILPELYPGRAFKLKSDEISGTFVAQRCQYQGSLFGDSFFIDTEARADGG